MTLIAVYIHVFYMCMCMCTTCIYCCACKHYNFFIEILYTYTLQCSYLEKVLEYLSGYIDRVHPLLDQNALYEEIEKEFEEKWLQGNFPGWRVRS